MSHLTTHRPLPPLSAHDVHYIQTHYLRLEEIAVERGCDSGPLLAAIRAGKLPLPSYCLPDGTPMFPADLLGLMQAAGGLELLEAWFVARCPERAQIEWEGYLTGEYGVCLHRVTPENIFLKERLVAELDEQLLRPLPTDAQWRSAFTAKMNALDELIRPFTACDRIRFGGPPSRERLITEPRRLYGL